MFDIDKAIKESKMPIKEIQKLESEIRKEFPSDRMMYELHLIRALDSLKHRNREPASGSYYQ